METQPHQTGSQPNIFHRLPYEIIRQLLLYLPVRDIARARQATKEIYHVASDPTLWRTCCLADFRYWNPEHGLRERLRQPVLLGHWESLYAIRVGRNKRASDWLEKIIRTRTDHIEHISVLTGDGFGYDVKDLLLKQMESDEDVEDVLARR